MIANNFIYSNTRRGVLWFRFEVLEPDVQGVRQLLVFECKLRALFVFYVQSWLHFQQVRCLLIS